MLVLSLDTASHGCSSCVWKDGDILSLVHEPMERGQDRRLLPIILESLEKAKVTFNELERIAVTRGPGSFTGLRIGLAVAGGLHLATNIPVVGIDRFSVFRADNKDADKLLVILDSKRRELFCQYYENNIPSEPTMLTVEEIATWMKTKNPLILTGDIHLEGLSIKAASTSEAIISAQIAASASLEDPSFLPQPLYIRPPDVTLASPILEKVDSNLCASLTHLHTQCFRDAAWNVEQMKGSLALPTTIGWYLTDRRQMIGFILCQALQEQWEILTFCVHPHHQRKGFGAKLLSHALAQSKAQKADLFLEVSANNVAAITLYEKVGFKLIGRRPNYYRHGFQTFDALTYKSTLIKAE